MKFESQEHHHAWYTQTEGGRRYAYASEAASEADRIWFENHPKAFCYLRPRLKDEFPPDPMEEINPLILVAQIRPGFRMRFPTSEAKQEQVMAQAAAAAKYFRSQKIKR